MRKIVKNDTSQEFGLLEPTTNFLQNHQIMKHHPFKIQSDLREHHSYEALHIQRVIKGHRVFLLRQTQRYVELNVKLNLQF